MTNEKLDLITLGRACIDLNANEFNCPMEETKTFSKYVGGSPANIAIGTAKLGLKVGFIGKVSDDQHGRFITEYLKQAQVDISTLSLDLDGRKSGLTFTEILSPDECSILMYRENVADLYLQYAEIDEDYIKNSQALLISGTALAQAPTREAALHAAFLAKKHNVKLIFELDYRPYTWLNTEETHIYYTLLAQLSTIIIGTREEFNYLENHGLTGDTSNKNNQETVDVFFKHEAELIVIKHGSEGSHAYTKCGERFDGRIFKSNVLKTFGAGDSYASGFLYGLFNGESISTALDYGAAAAAIVVSKHSSSDAMPTIEAIQELIKTAN